jgi:threonylcarbamoyladenosine tRNA methylthiotransferase MtaB
MNVFLDSIGCRLNQSEIETIANQFRAAGHQIVGNAGEADLIVINSCTVTNAAASDSRQKIHLLAQTSKAKIVVTGCWATLNTQAVAEMEGVKWVVPNPDKDLLVAEVLNLPPSFFDQKVQVRQLLPGSHRRTRAFIKIQDGCDNACTFCVTRLARGKSRSRLESKVVDDVKAAVMGGAKEIVLTGVQSGSWGKDLPGKIRLNDLVAAILKNGDVQRLRISSLEPWEVDDALLALWQDKRLCRHLHLPLQSGSAHILRRMGRKISPDEFAQLVTKVRSTVPEIALTTDIMVGFPGETDQEFETSKEFIRQMAFAGGHVFTYSAREATPAAHFPDQVPYLERKERNAQIRSILTESAQAYRTHFIDQTLHVLWESQEEVSPSKFSLSGLTDNDIRVYAVAENALWNHFSCVRLTEIVEGGMNGQVVELDIV